jgi:hypothetical protein
VLFIAVTMFPPFSYLFGSYFSTFASECQDTILHIKNYLSGTKEMKIRNFERQLHRLLSFTRYLIDNFNLLA